MEWQAASFPELAEGNGKQLRSLSLSKGMKQAHLPLNQRKGLAKKCYNEANSFSHWKE